MRLKKVLLGMGLIVALISSGCAAPKKPAEPVLNKSTVIKKSQQTFKSGQAKQLINLKTDTESQVITSTYTFGGNPTIFHLNYQTQAKGKSSNLEEWISNTNKAYINGQSTWYVTPLDKLTGHSYNDIVDAVMNNKMLLDPPNKLINAYQMKRSSNKYTLTATLTDKKIMQAAVQPIFRTNNQSKKQLPAYKQLAQKGTYQKMDVKLVVKKQKLASFSYKVYMKIGKIMQLEVGQSYANIGTHDFLKMPNNVLDAKPLPQKKK
ncbi:hypothetical protein [Lactobacillus sp. ESL0230]|uniref:hypothetical protein n=1 Tax=Lactobacillus sp. ESL0230 TaxID=2069353 RepID=UPI001F40135D|nr:hypothetical protein [Lactobacillus sp. ESL0230]